MRRWTDAGVAFAVIPGAMAVADHAVAHAILESDRSLVEALELAHFTGLGLWAGVIVLVALWAWRRGRARPALWGLGAGVLMPAWSFAVALASLLMAGGGDSACPNGRIYC